MARVHPQAAAETMIPRGTYFGRPVGEPPRDEAEHYIRCPGCGGWIDCRDLGQCSSTKSRCHIPLRINRNDRGPA
jgi:hypothetical protein